VQLKPRNWRFASHFVLILLFAVAAGPASSQEEGTAADPLADERAQWQQQLAAALESNEALAGQNTRLRERLAEARSALEQLDLAAERQRQRALRQWFLAGAGVLLAGILLGLLLPRLVYRRRSRWSDL